MKTEVAKLKDDKKTLTWEKTIRKNDFTKCVRVEQVTNGYIITIDEYGDVNGKYQSNCKKMISTENPLKDLEAKEESKEKKSPLDLISDFLNDED
jgi:hypothetical protein